MRPKNSESNSLIQWNVDVNVLLQTTTKHSHIYIVFLSYFTASRRNSESCLRLVAIPQHITITIAKTTHFYWIGNKTSNKDGNNTYKKSRKINYEPTLSPANLKIQKYKREHEISINNTHLFSFASVSFKSHWFKWIAVSCEMRWMKKQKTSQNEMKKKKTETNKRWNLHTLKS